MGCCSNRYENDLKTNGLRGPWQHRRTCTNPLVLLTFAAFCVCWVAILIWASEKGDVYRLLNGVDSFGNVCGRKNDDGTPSKNTHLDMTDFPLLYYTDPTDFENAPAICVRECPYDNDSTFATNDTVLPCTGCTNTSNATADDTCGSCAAFSVCISATGSSPYSENADVTWQASNNYCPPYTYATRPIIGRCWPSEDTYPTSTGVSQAGSITTGFATIIDGTGYIIQLYEFFYSARYQIMWTSLAALALALLVMILLRFVVAPIVWITILATILATTGAAAVLWLEYRRVRGDIETKEDEGGGVTDAEKKQRDFYLAMAVLVTVVAVVVFFVVIAMRTRISMAINIFQEASKALAHRPLLFLSPFVTYLFILAFVVLWVYGSILLGTLKEKEYDNTTGYYSYEWGDDPDDDEYQTLVGYHIFALLWVTQFIIASGNFVISGAVCNFYFTHTGKEPSAPSTGYLGSILIYVRYHMGTVAFGSLIIALIQAARLVLEYIKRKYEKEVGCVGRWIMCCFSCCLWCLEKCMKYINKNAYIITNLHGYPFCAAAWTAVNDLLANALLVFAINGVGFLVITLFKLCIAGATALFAYYMVSSDNGGSGGRDNLGSWFIITFAAFVGWLIATIFFELYSTVVDTVALCFMEDSKYNDGSDAKPYHASKSLQKFLHHAASKAGAEDPSDNDTAMKASKVTPI